MFQKPDPVAEAIFENATILSQDEIVRLCSQRNTPLSAFRTSKLYELHLALYHVYDGFLNPEYGSSADLLLTMALEPGLENVFENISIICPSRHFKRYFTNVIDLKHFLEDPTAPTPHCMLNFGTNTHSTKLLFTKFRDYVRVVYVNTGLGVSVDDYEWVEDPKSETQYFNLFKIACVPNEEIDEFCSLLRPFLFVEAFINPHWFRHPEDVQKKGYLHAMTFDGPVSTAKQEYFIDMYGKMCLPTSADTLQYFKEVLMLLARYQRVTLPVFQANVAGFVHVWNTQFKANTPRWKQMFQPYLRSDPNFLAYFTKAVDTFALLDVSGSLYVRPQRSGSCTYMSALVACLAVCTMVGGPNLCDNFFPFYRNLTEFAFSKLKTYPYTYIDTNDTVNAPLIEQQLVIDGIIPWENSIYTWNADGKLFFNRPPFALQQKMKEYIPDQVMLQLASEARAASTTWTSLEAQVTRKQGTDMFLLFWLWTLYHPDSFRGLTNFFEFNPTLLRVNLNILLFLRFPATEDEVLWITKCVLSAKHLTDKPVTQVAQQNQSILGAIFPNFTFKRIQKHCEKIFYESQQANSFCMLLLEKGIITTPASKDDLYYLSDIITMKYAMTFFQYFFKRLSLDDPVLDQPVDLMLLASVFYFLSNTFDTNDRQRIALLLLTRVARADTNNLPSKDLLQALVLLNLVFENVILKDVFSFAKRRNKIALLTEVPNPRIRSYIRFTSDILPKILGVLRQSLKDGVVDPVVLNAFTFKDVSHIHSSMLPYAVNASGEFSYVYQYSEELPPSDCYNYYVLDKLKQSAYVATYLNHAASAWIESSVRRNGTLQNIMLCVLPSSAYKGDLSQHDWVIELPTDKSRQNLADKDLIGARINGERIVECVLPIRRRTSDLLSRYPFLCSLPRSCLVLITEQAHNNSTKVYLLHHISRAFGDSCFRGAVINKLVADLMNNKRLVLHIKQNYLLPAFTRKEHELFTKMMDMSANTHVASVFDTPILRPKLEPSALLVQACPAVEFKVQKYHSAFQLLQAHVNAGEDPCREPPPGMEAALYTTAQQLDKDIAQYTQIRGVLCLSIRTFDYNSVFEFLSQEIYMLYRLLQVNTFITTLRRMQQLFANWKSANCYELMELDARVQPYPGCEMNQVDAAFQIVFGNLIRAEQWTKYYEIVDAFKSGRCRVFQFMMGKGKSSLITPMLLHYLSCAPDAELALHVVVPSHLKPQTQDTLWEYEQFLYLPTAVVTDTEVKLAFLQTRNQALPVSETAVVFSPSSVFIYDEVDDMYNPSKSTLNMVQSQTHIDPAIIVELFFKGLEAFGLRPETPTHAEYQNQFLKIIGNNNLKRNEHFGMSRLPGVPPRYCIPYEERLDSPMEGSRFTSVLFTLALTLRYFFDQKHRAFYIFPEDIRKICSVQEDEVLESLLAEWNVEENGYEKVETTLLRKMGPVSRTVQPETMQKYFVLIFQEYLVSQQSYNCAFVDVMNLRPAHMQWAVGYSGTVLMDLSVTKDQRFEEKISRDSDEDTGVRQALEAASVEIIDSPEKVVELVRTDGYGAVIDACALFKTYTNDEVAKMLYDAANGLKEVVFVRADKNDSKMSWGPAGPVPYTQRHREPDSVIYFFSQRHIIGIDFQNQPAVIKGLLLLGPLSTRTQAAQAMYRLRKLNKGHYINVGACFQAAFPPGNVLQPLIDQDLLMYSRKDVLLRLQTIKYLQRKDETSETNAYAEIPVSPLQIRPPNYSVEAVYQQVLQLFPALKSSRALSEEASELLKNMTATRHSIVSTMDTLLNRSDAAAETAVAMESATATATATAVKTAVSTLINREAFQFLNYFWFFSCSKQVWDWTAAAPVVPSGWLTLEFARTIVVLSFNLLKNKSVRGLFLIRVSLHTYLVEPITMLPYYFVCGKPLYSMTGKVLNNFFPFLMTEYPPLDVSELLNANCFYNMGSHADVLNLRHLFHLPRPTHRTPPVSVPLSNTQFKKLCHLFCQFQKNGDVVPTPANLEGLLLATRTYPKVYTKWQATITEMPAFIPCTKSSHPLHDLYQPELAVPPHEPFVFEDNRCTVPQNLPTQYHKIVERNDIERGVLESWFPSDNPRVLKRRKAPDDTDADLDFCATPECSASSPAYNLGESSAYAPTSPAFSHSYLKSPEYEDRGWSPAYASTSPAYASTSPAYAPTSPAYAPSSPASSPAYYFNSLANEDQEGSPGYAPSSKSAKSAV
jgi:hypothetical protein